MEKKGAVSLSTKVIIGLVVGIPVVLAVTLVGAKVLNLILSSEEEGNFDKLITKIESLGAGRPIYFKYHIGKKYTLIGFNKGQEKAVTGVWISSGMPSLIPGSIKTRQYSGVSRPESCDINFACLCLCDFPIEELEILGNIEKAKCVSLEEISSIEGRTIVHRYLGEKEKEVGPFLIEGKAVEGGEFILSLERKEDGIVIESLI